MTDLHRMTDDDLLATTLDDPEAFGVFYERHAETVLRFLMHRSGGDTELSLDMTAETFATVLGKVPTYRRGGEASARTWLFGIAKNLLADSRRRNARARAMQHRLGMEELDYSEEAIEEIVRLLDTTSPDYVRAMDRLSPEEREAIMARVVEEQEYVEIAEATGSSQPAIRQRVSRGLAKLGRLIARPES